MPVATKKRRVKKEVETTSTKKRYEFISKGTLNASIVHPRDVFRVAIIHGAAAIILVHNHPSGDPSPSQEDIDLTRRLVEAGKLMGINILDHIIIGGAKFMSMKEMNLL